MKKCRYSVEQIVRILRDADRDTVVDVAKRYGVSEALIFTWRKRFGGMVSSHVKRLNTLESENTRLKKLVAERDLKIEVMKGISAKKGAHTGSSRTCPFCNETRAGHCAAEIC